MTKRVLMVVDVSNLFYCTKKRWKAKVDFAQYKEVALTDVKGELFKAVAYGSQMDDQANNFIAALKHIGFITNFKTPNEYPGDIDGQIIRKADWDVGIAMDVVRANGRFDTLVLGSADGDMTPLVKWCQEQGATVHVFASGISSQLRETADSWKEIDQTVLRAFTFTETSK